MLNIGFGVLMLFCWGQLGGTTGNEAPGFFGQIYDFSWDATTKAGSALGNGVSATTKLVGNVLLSTAGQVAVNTKEGLKEWVTEGAQVVADMAVTAARNGTVALGQRVEYGFISARDTMRSKLGEVGYVVALVSTCVGFVMIIWNAATKSLTVREKRRVIEIEEDDD